MERTVEVNNSIIMQNVKESKGKETHCILADTIINGKKLKLTYDVKEDNLVISNWYQIQQDALPIIIELLKSVFEQLAEDLEQENGDYAFQVLIN